MNGSALLTPNKSQVRELTRNEQAQVCGSTSMPSLPSKQELDERAANGLSPDQSSLPAALAPEAQRFPPETPGAEGRGPGATVARQQCINLTRVTSARVPRRPLLSVTICSYG